MQRRRFLQLAGATASATTMSSLLGRALSLPAHSATGSIRDVEHVVFLMQENRSFDHYYGTLPGVRGFGDPRAVNLRTGKSVFHQPSPSGDVLPFHPPAPEMGLQFVEDLAHDWTSTHHAWNGGEYDGWIASKTHLTMAHLKRQDIPYHFALAEAFTICDAYHCSLMGPTDPNRYYMFSGWVGNDGAGGGPVVDNAEAGYTWRTYPERLQAAGVSWKVYQDVGKGIVAAHSWGDDGSDPYIGNYGDNSLLWFKQYREAPDGHPLHAGAKTGTSAREGGSLFEQFAADVQAGTLPQVSWVVAPEAYSEHPNWPANYGAWYVSQVVDALTANPEVWSKTALFIMFDENDGFFDHVVPPTPPSTRAEGLSNIDTMHEHFAGAKDLVPGPYGLGVRVPMLVVSPWSRGGWVNSQVFDHSSLIRFLEARFGPDHPELMESNITPWRRAVCGDLTSAFNFVNPNEGRVVLPATAHYMPPDRLRHPDYRPAAPEDGTLPVQEPGVRPAVALPYELEAAGSLHPDGNSFRIRFNNTGAAAAVFQVRSAAGAHAPRCYTVAAGSQLEDTWDLAQADYDLSVYGPNGFYRGFLGHSSQQPLQTGEALEIVASYDRARTRVALALHNRGTGPAMVRVHDRYTDTARGVHVPAGGTTRADWSTSAHHGWYDLVLTSAADPAWHCQVAGHIETGKPSMTDPAIAAT